MTRASLDKVASEGRAAAPFIVVWRDEAGNEQRAAARAVIDASGTWSAPNPIGVDGLTVEGELAAGARIAYGLPDALGRDRADYAGRRVLVIGGGHSAINVALDLLRLQEAAPGTRVTWALRRDRIDRLVGGATGFRPELGMLRELRVSLDPAVEAPPALAPLIDPNLHSCGTVPPHGAAELAHPSRGSTSSAQSPTGGRRRS